MFSIFHWKYMCSSLFHLFQPNLCLSKRNMGSWSDGSGILKHMPLQRQIKLLIHSFLLSHSAILYWSFVTHCIKYFRYFTFLVASKWSHLLTAYLALYSFLSFIILNLIFRITKDCEKLIWIPYDINGLQWQ